MEKYRHLSQEERNIISNMLQDHDVHITSDSVTAPPGLIGHIASVLGRSRSTISRELRRNAKNGRYEPKLAHSRAQRRLKSKGKKRIPLQVEGLIDAHLRLKRSPELIAHLLEKERGIKVSVEWIYQYVYRHKQGHLLPSKRRRRRPKKRQVGDGGRGRLKNQVSISQRPVEADERTESGHWEVDTMELGKGQGFVVVAVERRSRLILAELVRSKHAEGVSDALIRMLGAAGRRHRIRTITSDNGKEFAHHREVTQALGADGWYFAHPYSPWERGSIENAIGLLRRWYHKGMTYEKAKNIDMTRVLIELNNRPRKTLGWRSSLEIFNSTL